RLGAARASRGPRARARHPGRLRADRARQRAGERPLPQPRRDVAAGCRVDVLVRGRLTVLRPADRGDGDRLAAWHGDPGVARYWDGETFTHAEIEERLALADVEAWVVQEDDEPVGYLQVHADGLDMFLVPSARGRGLGPDAARAMARHLIDEHHRVRV